MSDTPTRREVAESGLSSHALFAVALPYTQGNDCYLTRGDGDPPRTHTPEHASRYTTIAAAKRAMVWARKKTPLRERYMHITPHPCGTDEQVIAAAVSMGWRIVPHCNWRVKAWYPYKPGATTAPVKESRSAVAAFILAND